MNEMPTKTITELCADGIKRQRTIIDVMPGQARLMRLGYTNMIVDESRITNLEKTIADMVQCRQRVSPSASFENCTESVHTPLQAEGESAMANNRMRICVGYNDDGTQIVKRISGETELQLADNAVRAILNSERRSEFVNDVTPLNAEPKGDVPTFSDYAEMWINTYKKQRIKPTTLGGYRTILESHLYPTFGAEKISAITTKSIQEMLNGKSDKSRKTLQDIMILLRAIMESALKDGIIPKNPADDKRITIPSMKKTTRNALGLNDIKSIIASIETLPNLDDRRFEALLIFTGMRRGEVLGLQWRDIDLVNNVIHVERNVTYPRGCNQPVIGTTKTESGVREIPIIPKLLDLLKPIGTTGFIIGDGKTPNTLSVVRRRNERINRLIDMHGATPHVFRYSFGTLLYSAGASIKDIQSILGQSDFKTTADRYLHPRDETKRSAVNAVDQMLLS